MKKIVLTGGPSTGKSTLFDALKKIYPDAVFVEEAAAILIKKELRKQFNDPNYDPALPVSNYQRFAPMVIDQQIELEKEIPYDKDLVFLDRSIVDNIGYLEFNGITEHINKVQEWQEIAGYTLALFCDWLGRLERTEIRLETEDQGFAVHQYLQSAYESSGIPLVHLPAINVEERLELIKSILDSVKK